MTTWGQHGTFQVSRRLKGEKKKFGIKAIEFNEKLIKGISKFYFISYPVKEFLFILEL